MPRMRRSTPDLSVFWIGLLFLLFAMTITSAGRSGTKECLSELAGVCYPVDGTGYIVSNLGYGKVPIGSLSPLLECDSLVVESGTITFMDFRNGKSRAYESGTRTKIPIIRKPKRPPWYKEFQDHLARSFHGPEGDRIAGSVRAGSRAFWPDTARYAPGVPVPFDWVGVDQEPESLRIVVGVNVKVIPVERGEPDRGTQLWTAPSGLSGKAVWTLLSRDRRDLGGGEFEILTLQAAEAERERFHSAARDSLPESMWDFAARVLAKEDRAYLW